MSPDPFERIGLSREELDGVTPSDYDVRTMHEFNPLSGRYAKYTDPLREITSEFEWVKRRAGIGVEYIIGLSEEFQKYKGAKPKLFERPFNEKEKEAFRKVYGEFSDADFSRFRRIEDKTQHDDVATNLLVLFKLWDIVNPVVLERAMHIGRTSSDLDSNAMSEITHDIIGSYYLPRILGVEKTFIGKAGEWHKAPDGYGRPFTVMVAETHEQPAVPMPIKKIASNIVKQIDQGVSKLIETSPDGKDGRFRLYGKMGGAVGNDEAMMAAYPGHDWRDFYKRFIEDRGLKYQKTTDQDEFNMKFIELCDIIRRTNLPLLKWSDDYSSYMSRGILKKKTRKGEKDSSIMVQKVNPWRTEGGEIALVLADAELSIFEYLAKQRKQGDLRRSFLKRYFAVPMGNIGIAIGRINEDLNPTYANHEAIEKELIEHPEIASASMQMILRAAGVPHAYDMMVDVTRGKHVTPEIMEQTAKGLVDGGSIGADVGDEIRAIFKHENNVGDSLKIADDDLAEAMCNIKRLENVYNQVGE
jgi:adenylosuccinate lyase